MMSHAATANSPVQRRFVVRGDLDRQQAIVWRRRWLKALRSGQHVELDLARVHRLDTCALAAMIEALNVARARSREFALAEISPEVAELVSLHRLEQLLLSQDRFALARVA